MIVISFTNNGIKDRKDENFDQKSHKKNHFLAKISGFWAKNAKIFKNKTLIKKVRKHSLDTCI